MTRLLLCFLAVYVAGCSGKTESPQKKELENTVEASLEQMTAIGAATKEFVDKNRNYPSVAIMSADGKTKLLSWRVAILPFIGHEELYKKFKLDEPWDSPDNKKLLDEMPDVYRTPGNTNPSETHYLAVTGKGTTFESGKKITFGKLTRGSRNVVMMVEADKSVPWTKPDEYDIDTHSGKQGLGNIRKADGVILIVLGSGEPIEMPTSMSDAELRMGFMIADPVN